MAPAPVRPKPMPPMPHSHIQPEQQRARTPTGTEGSQWTGRSTGDHWHSSASSSAAGVGDSSEGQRWTAASSSRWVEPPSSDRGSFNSGHQTPQRVREDPDAPVIAEAPRAFWARRGDWICPSCGDEQFERNIACRSCWRQKPQYTRLQDGTVVPTGAAQAWEGDWWCPICRAANFARNNQCRGCCSRKPGEPEILDLYIVNPNTGQKGRSKGGDKGKAKGKGKGSDKGKESAAASSSGSGDAWANYRPARLRPNSESAAGSRDDPQGG